MTRYVFLPVIAGPLVLLALPEQDEKKRKPYGLTKRVPWTTSRLIGTPDAPPPYTTARVFPKLQFKNPIYIAQEPNSDRVMVAELKGKILAFSKDKAQPKSLQTFLDIKRQIYSFSFHPNYEKNGHVFVLSPNPGKSRVSRFIAKGNPKRCDPKSETIIVEWPAGGHNGGEAIIGPDGYLYISTGDSTSTSDLKNTGQGLHDLLAVVMRIDVDNPAPGKPYSIPKDNPFVNVKGARPEIWAFGFRNPWRMSFDPKTKLLWMGDIGQDIWEMVRIVKRGGNYGWSVQEGSHVFRPNRKIGPGPILPPVVEHHHVECRSITGGYVYYGKKFPELNGVYLYGDYEYGKVWGLRYDLNAKTTSKQNIHPKNSDRRMIIHDPKVIWHKELADSALRIVSMGGTREGDVYFVDHTTGHISELRRAEAQNKSHTFPRKLSETGLFKSTKDHIVAAGVIPFTVNTPGWMDGATADRFLAMPGDTHIAVPKKDADVWRFEDGTVTAQTVYLEMETGNPNSRRRLETRVMVRQQNHWLGYSYLWNDEQTDAHLVGALGKDLEFTIKDKTADNGKRRQTWHIPSRNECMYCHSRAAGFVLGLRTIQMNKTHKYGDVTDNQLRAFNHIGLFKNRLVEQSLYTAKKPKKADKQPSDYQAAANAYDESADLNARARAYLHVNCSICHVGSGGGNSRFEIRHDTKLSKGNLVNIAPLHGTFGLPNGKILKPGDPYASVLYYRVSKLGAGRMPHIGSKRIDTRAVNMLHDWILHLDAKGTYQKKVDPSKNADRLRLERSLSAIAKLPAQQQGRSIAKLYDSPRDALILAHLLGSGPYTGDLRESLVAAGVKHPNTNIRDLFERFVPEHRRVRRLGSFIDPKTILSLVGNADEGKKLFLMGNGSLCKSCHRIQGTGIEFGPDLSLIGKKYKREEILDSILNPSRKMEEKHRAHLVLTKSGSFHTGIIAERSDKRIVLKTYVGNTVKTIRIPTRDIERSAPQTKSLMPDGLLAQWTPQQAADLLAYLTSCK